MSKIKCLNLSGFKTIRDIQDLQFDDINIFIGANGSGKSNIISFFEMISYMMTKGFGKFVSDNGFASSMLYHGQKVTQDIEAKINFESNNTKSFYQFKIYHTIDDRFLFESEVIQQIHKTNDKSKTESLLDTGYKETKLRDIYTTNRTAKNIKDLLSSIRVFHFHDTSRTAYMHIARPLESNSYLLSDGGNIASFLYKLKHKEPKYYERILSYVKQVAPFLDDFVLEPVGDSIQLRFKEVNSDLQLGSFRLSDGIVRFICLATLLLQPRQSLPNILMIDEPELGLHPVAIDILSEMINIASINSQIFITTQSPRLIDQFEPKNIIVINRKQDDDGRYCSDFEKFTDKGLSSWLEDYSLADMWDSNILGGRP